MKSGRGVLTERADERNEKPEPHFEARIQPQR